MKPAPLVGKMNIFTRAIQTQATVRVFPSCGCNQFHCAKILVPPRRLRANDFVKIRQDSEQGSSKLAELCASCR